MNDFTYFKEPIGSVWQYCERELLTLWVTTNAEFYTSLSTATFFPFTGPLGAVTYYSTANNDIVIKLHFNVRKVKYYISEVIFTLYVYLNFSQLTL